MTTSIIVQVLIRGAGLGAGAALLCLLGLQMRDRRTPSLLAMSVFMALLMLDSGLGVAEALDLQARLPWLFGLDIAVQPFLPPVLWLYVAGLTGSASGRWWRHLVAPCAALLCLLPLMTLDASLKSALSQGRIVSRDTVHQIVAAVGVFVAWGVWIGVLAVYGIALLRRLRRHDRQLRDSVSNLEGLELGWIRHLMSLIAAVTLLTLADQVLSLFGHDILPPASAATFETLVILLFGVLGVRQAMAHRLAPHAPEPPIPYARSGLTPEDCDRILARLDAVMRDQHLWRNPFFSLKDLAEASGARANAISQALNTRRGRNFFDYVNGFRIEDACRLLRDSDRTVIDISLDVGFNSKSTFNAAFSRHAGMTPSQYRRKA